MKKTILAAMILAAAAAGVQTAKAGDREWAMVGKILTGAVVAEAVTHAVAAPVCHTYSYPTRGYGYCPPPPRRVIYAPRAPMVVYHPPVCVVRGPVYVAPPVVGGGFGGGQRHHFRHGHR